MKLLMIYPNRVSIARVPLGLGYISSYLKADGHEMKLFDTTFFKCSDSESDDTMREKSLQIKNPEFGYMIGKEDIFDELKKVINEYKPDLIGMTVVDPNYKFGLSILKFCKQICPFIKIVVGGPLTTFIPEIIIKEDCIDAIGRGECEIALTEFCNKYQTFGWDKTYNTQNFWIKDSDGKIHKNDIKLFNSKFSLNPDLSIYDDRHFIRPLGGKIYRMATVMWTRGCLFNCSYCANKPFFETAKVSPKKYYRINDVQTLVYFLKDIKEKYKLEFIMFVDDIWPMHHPELIKEFCNLYKEHVGLPFSVNLHCKIVREDSFEKAVDAGLRNICVGVESGNQRIRKEILNRNYKDSELQLAFDLAHKYKIRSSSFNILGMPTETREDIFDTIRLNRKLNPNSATVTIFHPYRGSLLRQMCVDNRYIEEGDDKFEDVYRADSHLDMPQITKQELKGLMNSFQLYMKLPEETFDLIKQQEDDSEKSKKIRKEIIMPLFENIGKEPTWNFNKKIEWWKE